MSNPYLFDKWGITPKTGLIKQVFGRSTRNHGVAGFRRHWRPPKASRSPSEPSLSQIPRASATYMQDSTQTAHAHRTQRPEEAQIMSVFCEACLNPVLSPCRARIHPHHAHSLHSHRTLPAFPKSQQQSRRPTSVSKADSQHSAALGGKIKRHGKECAPARPGRSCEFQDVAGWRRSHNLVCDSRYAHRTAVRM